MEVITEFLDIKSTDIETINGDNYEHLISAKKYHHLYAFTILSHLYHIIKEYSYHREIVIKKVIESKIYCQDGKYVKVVDDIKVVLSDVVNGRSSKISVNSLLEYNGIEIQQESSYQDYLERLTNIFFDDFIYDLFQGIGIHLVFDDDNMTRYEDFNHTGWLWVDDQNIYKYQCPYQYRDFSEEGKYIQAFDGCSDDFDETLLEDFWGYGYKNNFSPEISIACQNQVTVISYKGKYWYIVVPYEFIEIPKQMPLYKTKDLVYVNTNIMTLSGLYDDTYEYDTEEMFIQRPEDDIDKKIVNNVLEILERYKKNLEVDSSDNK